MIFCISCSKDDDDDSKSTGSYFTYKKHKYELSKGQLTYCFKESSSVFFHEFTIYSSTIRQFSGNFSGVGDWIALGFYSSSKTELPEGTYRISTTLRKAGYIDYAEIDMQGDIQKVGDEDYEGEFASFRSGSMSVTKNGSVYRIEISGSDRDGNEIYATYIGKLDYFDDSEGE